MSHFPGHIDVKGGDFVITVSKRGGTSRISVRTRRKGSSRKKAKGRSKK